MLALNTVDKMNRGVFGAKLPAGLSRGLASGVTSEVGDPYNVGKQ